MFNNIILVGMPGSGKSSIGEILSEKLNLKFIDTDKVIEKDTQLSIQDIFKKYGETFFREKEREWILKNYNIKKTVIATGGGMAAYFNNIEILKKIGITVFIDVDLKVIKKRLENDTNRPLIKGNGNKNNVISDLYNSRKSYYSKCHIHIDLMEESPECIAEVIKEKIKNYS